MFKLKEFENESSKKVAKKEVLERLDKLPLQIDLIRKYKSGTDVRKLDWSYDIVLIMDFDTMDELEAYTVHPAHKEFVAFNKDYSVAKTCIDFEI